jgi:hypothetical protein
VSVLLSLLFSMEIVSFFFFAPYCIVKCGKAKHFFNLFHLCVEEFIRNVRTNPAAAIMQRSSQYIILGQFAKLRKTTVSFVMSLRPSVRMKQLGLIGLVFIKFVI